MHRLSLLCALVAACSVNGGDDHVDPNVLAPFIHGGGADDPYASDPTVVGLYHFDGDLSDSSPLRAHLGGSTPPQFMSSPHGEAIFYGGVFEDAQLPAQDLGEGDFTIMTWIQGNSAPFVSNDQLAFRGRASTSLSSGWALETSFSSALEWRLISRGHDQTLQLPASVSDAGWHHVAVVRRGSVLEAYLDGLGAATQPFEGNLEDPLFGAPGPLTLHPTEPLDELVIAKRAFSAQELATAAGAGTVKNGCKGLQACLVACSADQACLDGCVAGTSAFGMKVDGALELCIWGDGQTRSGACPSNPGGVCDGDASRADACVTCINAATAQGGPCAIPFAECQADLP